MVFGDASTAAVVSGVFAIVTGLLFWWLNRRSKRQQRQAELDTGLEAALKKAEEINAQERAEDKSRIKSLESQVREQQKEIVRLSRGRSAQ